MERFKIILLLPCLQVVCEDNEYKMTIVVNSQPQLSIGKTAAQVAHGAVSLFTLLMKKESCRTSLQLWLKQGQPKVVLRGLNPDQMLQIKDKAKKIKIYSCLIHDAGRTEVKEGTLTVLALFGKESKLKKVTSSLPLLK